MAKTQKLIGDFEYFKPASEWKEEPENNIIILHLPDFTKEQMKITCVKSTRRLRVHGERKLANNKWSRIDESFPIPDNCKMDKIHAKWHEGSLRVTLPKEIVTPIAPKEPSKTAEGKEVTLVPAKTPQDPLPSKQGAAATSSSPMSDTGIDGKSSAYISSLKGTPSLQGERQTDAKRVVDAHALSAHQEDQKGSEETSQKLDTSTSKTTTKQTDDHDKTVLQPKLGHLAEHKGKSEAKKETPSEKSQEKKSETKEEAKEKKSITAGASKAVMKQNEERQSMVNMGVAVLVIFALGAYISYSFSSKSKSSSSGN